jgi:Na+-driven multidrug efflux pump
MMWAAISTKIGRAVGAKDYAAIGKYFKMAARLGIGSAFGSMAIIYPFGPTVMKHLYLEGKPHVYKLAVECLYIITFGMSLDYLCGVGSGVVQG